MMYGRYPSICSVSCIHSYIDISAWLFSPEFVSRQLHIMTTCRSMNKTTTGTAYERLTARNLVVVYPDPSGGNDPICLLQCWFLSYLGWNQEARKWFTYVVMTFLNCVVHLEDSLIFAYWRWVKGSLNWLSQDPKHVSIWPGDWFRMDNEWIHF